MKKTTGLEKACAKTLNQFAVDEFFDMLTEVTEEYNILPGNLYNMDEKGIQLGIGVKITAMIDRDCKGTSVRFLTSPILSHLLPVHMYSPSSSLHYLQGPYL
jgi:hypothetical protein